MIINTRNDSLRHRRTPKIAENLQKNLETWQTNTMVRAVKKMKIAGIRQALKSGIDWTERLWWIGVFFLCLGFTAFFTVETINEYAENPVLYTFHDDEPTYEVPFPGTTISGTMIFKNNTIEDAIKLQMLGDRSQHEEFEHEGTTWTLQLVDILIFTIDHLCELVKSFTALNEIKNEGNAGKINILDDPDWAHLKNVKVFDNKEDRGIQEKVVPYLKTRTLDCKKILIACSWEGSRENCTDLFVTIQTDVGSGCSFNRIPEELLTKQRGLMSLFNQHYHADDEIRAWEKYTKESLDSVISVKGIEDFFAKIRPRAQRNAGKLRGLSFMVKFDEELEAMSCPIVDSNGYLLGIHSPFEEPQMMKIGVAIPPRHEIFVTVKAALTISDKGIKSLHISKRKCYFQEENPLQNFKVYTVGNCHQECLGRTIKEKCNCTLLTRSVGENEKLCGPMEQYCVEQATDDLEKGRYDNLCTKPVCYPSCNDVKYDADASYLPYSKNEMFYSERLGLKKKTVTSITHVAFPSNSVSTRQRKLQFGFSIIVGALGGLWGMTLEFTIFTFFNVLAGIGVLISSNCQWLKVEDEEENENFPRDEEAPPEGFSGNDEEIESGQNRVQCILTIENETDDREPSQLGDEETSGNLSTGNYENTVDQDVFSEEIINENQNNFSSLPSVVLFFSNCQWMKVEDEENENIPGDEEAPQERFTGNDEESETGQNLGQCILTIENETDAGEPSHPGDKETPGQSSTGIFSDEIINENQSNLVEEFSSLPSVVRFFSNCQWMKVENLEENENIPGDEEAPKERFTGNYAAIESGQNRFKCSFSVENETDGRESSVQKAEETTRQSSTRNQENNTVDQEPFLPEATTNKNNNVLAQGFSSLSVVDGSSSTESNTTNSNVNNDGVNLQPEEEVPSTSDTTETTDENHELKNESESLC